MRKSDHGHSDLLKNFSEPSISYCRNSWGNFSLRVILHKMHKEFLLASTWLLHIVTSWIIYRILIITSIITVFYGTPVAHQLNHGSSACADWLVQFFNFCSQSKQTALPGDQLSFDNLALAEPRRAEEAITDSSRPDEQQRPWDDQQS